MTRRGQVNGRPVGTYTNLDVTERDMKVRCGHFSLQVSGFSS
jgi:hypothetical protein